MNKPATTDDILEILEILKITMELLNKLNNDLSKLSYDLIDTRHKITNLEYNLTLQLSPSIPTGRGK